MSNKNIKVYREPYPTKKFIHFIENENINDDFLLAVQLWFKKAADKVPDAPEEFYIYHRIMQRIIDEKIFQNYEYSPNYLMIMRGKVSMEDYCALLEAMAENNNPKSLIRNALLTVDLNIENILENYLQYFDAHDLGMLWNKKNDARKIILSYVILHDLFEDFMEPLRESWSVADIYDAVPGLAPELKLGILI